MSQDKDQFEIQWVTPLPLPFNLDDTIFNYTDQETGEMLGGPYSYNDWLKIIQNISGVTPDLLGERE